MCMGTLDMLDLVICVATLLQAPERERDSGDTNNLEVSPVSSELVQQLVQQGVQSASEPMAGIPQDH